MDKGSRALRVQICWRASDDYASLFCQLLKGVERSSFVSKLLPLLSSCQFYTINLNLRDLDWSVVALFLLLESQGFVFKELWMVLDMICPYENCT